MFLTNAYGWPLYLPLDEIKETGFITTRLIKEDLTAIFIDFNGDGSRIEEFYNIVWDNVSLDDGAILHLYLKKE